MVDVQPLIACLLGAALLGPCVALATHDPTQPPAVLQTAPVGPSPAPTPPMQVSTIILAGKASLAIVDGREVRLGDRLGDRRVSRIDEHGVWLSENGKTWLLHLLPDIKNPPHRP